MLVSAAIAISYLDRQTLPVAIKAIERDIPVTNQQFSLLQTAFLITYAFMYAAGGRLLDVLGTRRGFTIIMVFWSLACAGHGLATSFGMLAACRLLLGAGEGGGFPAATRVVAEWFPVKERSTAMGIMNAGTALGMVVAPPLIALLLSFDELALDLPRHGRPGPPLDGVVAARLLPPRGAPEAGRRGARPPPVRSCSRRRRREGAGLARSSCASGRPGASSPRSS